MAGAKGIELAQEPGVIILNRDHTPDLGQRLDQGGAVDSEVFHGVAQERERFIAARIAEPLRDHAADDRAAEAVPGNFLRNLHRPAHQAAQIRPGIGHVFKGDHVGRVALARQPGGNQRGHHRQILCAHRGDNDIGLGNGFRHLAGLAGLQCAGHGNRNFLTMVFRRHHHAITTQPVQVGRHIRAAGHKRGFVAGSVKQLSGQAASNPTGSDDHGFHTETPFPAAAWVSSSVPP